MSPIYAEGSRNRATAATSMNAHSSRSHALLTVRLTDEGGQSSVLHLVDLAGGLLMLLGRPIWRGVAVHCLEQFERGPASLLHLVDLAGGWVGGRGTAGCGRTGTAA